MFTLMLILRDFRELQILLSRRVILPKLMVLLKLCWVDGYICRIYIVKMLCNAKLLRVPGDEHARISFDCNDYRKLRMQELRMTAEAAADRVISTGSAFTFNPMNRRERRVIHLSLRNREEVRSESASSIHGRYVVIYPAAMAMISS